MGRVLPCFHVRHAGAIAFAQQARNAAVQGPSLWKTCQISERGASVLWRLYDTDLRVLSPTPSSRAGTDISSSRSSQCRPVPPPLITHFARSAGAASRRRGKYASGTPSLRPSAKSTHMVSSSNLTCFARASDTEIDCDGKQIAQLTGSQPISTSDPGLRFQPKFRHAIRLSHMDVQWL